nr:uncharacterized protein CI109_002191 [Kwoniella shandongensis]KAA5529298.1 hypothetical protein CI109_002191 [Kwoniella shandongensis]
MFSTLAPIALLLLAASGLQQVQAVYPGAYVACVNSNADLVEYSYVSDAVDAPDCATSCFGQGSTYSYFLPAVATNVEIPGRKRTSLLARDTPATCYCTETAPPLASLGSSEESDGSGTCYNNMYTVFVTTTTYQFSQCYSNVDYDPLAPFAAANPEECLRACVTYDMAVFQYNFNANDPAFLCACAPDNLALSNPSACDSPSFFTYRHVAGASVNSQFAKRQLRERLVKERTSNRGVCPTPLTACKISNAGDSFECINSNEELESCGGCINGAFNDNEVSAGVE